MSTMFVVVARDGIPLGVFPTADAAHIFRNTGPGTLGADVFQVPVTPDFFDISPRPKALPRRVVRPQPAP